ncbi:MAG: Formyl-CoA transferase [Bradyrhizobium sp.]|nr:Formyl-CoA transferase [Bradyrhizobium sp.]
MTSLAGIKVLDFGRYVAGPYCAALLGDFGADVIRIEKRTGSEDRFLTPVTPQGDGALFLQLARNKRSLALDLKHPEGREIVRRLVLEADVVIANLPTPALVELGLDYPALKALKQDIIVVSLSSFGQLGPWSDRLGFDSIGQAMSGAVHLTGQPEQPYRDQVNWIDYATALHAAFGVMVALRERDRSGIGQEVSGSLLATAIAINNAQLIEQAVRMPNREAIGNRSATSGPTDLFRTSDGWIVTHVVGNALFRRWARLMEEEALWTSDPDFASDDLRGTNGARLSERMARWCAERTQGEALDALAVARIPAGPVLSAQQTLDHEQVQALGLLQPMEYSGLPAPAPVARAPVFLSATPGTIRNRAPTLGEHNEEILSELGYAPGEIGALSAAKIIS